MSKLYALLIGINAYHPASGVRRLKGCENDVKTIKKVIEEKYSFLNPSIKTLLDSEATRNGIINSFRHQFSENNDITEGDVVLFYFSGHGSFSKTAAEFESFDPEKHDETLVCYDSRLDGKYDLADKEVAVLLSSIKVRAQIILIIDSCHSSSMSRSIEGQHYAFQAKYSPNTNKARMLADYLPEQGSYYANLYSQSGRLSIPRTPHILLSACQRNQLAWERDDQRGLFTATLTEVLEKAAINTSFIELFSRVRNTIIRYTSHQTPTLSHYQFDPQKVFLLNFIKSSNQKLLVEFRDGNWCIDLGAVHGMPTNTNTIQEIRLALYSDLTSTNPNIYLGETFIKDVKLKESFLTLSQEDTRATYQAEIIGKPQTFSIYLDGSDKDKSDFLEVARSLTTPFPPIVTTNKARYILRVDRDRLMIYDNDSHQLVHGREGSGKRAIQYICNIFRKIDKWERIMALDNTTTKLNREAVKLSFFEELSRNQVIEHKEKNLSLCLNNSELIKGVDYRITTQNASDQELYVCLLYLSRKFGIYVHFECQKIPSITNLSYPKPIILDDSHTLAIRDEHTENSTNIFKLIVSTAAFDDFVFHEDSIELGEVAPIEKDLAHRGEITRQKKAEEDWFTHTLSVKLTKRTL